VLRVARQHGIDGALVLLDAHEMWLPARGLEGRYEVSSRCRVRSVRTGRILKTRATGPFYPMVDLDGRTYRTHILMAEAFLGPRPPGRIALHHNNIKTDSRIANVRWGTHGDNYRDALRNGRNPFGRSALTGAQQ
jgi:HNH endonuclease/NUMOD4 motif